MNRSADWFHQARADLELAGVSAAAGHHEWGHGLGRSLRDLPAPVASALKGAPTDHFGRLQSDDAQRHARTILDAIHAALA